MKKIIVLSFVAAAVIFIGMTLSSSTLMIKGNPPVPAQITYQVVIHPDWTIIHNQCPMLVAVTDGKSGIIGQPKPYVHGVNTYNFYETGPVNGVRKAILMNSPIDKPNDVCMAVSATDSKSGTFNNGNVYMFNIYGSARNIIDKDNSTVNH